LTKATSDNEWDTLGGIVTGTGAGLLAGGLGGNIVGAHERWRQVNLNELGRR
jgi:hypothetical protein